MQHTVGDKVVVGNQSGTVVALGKGEFCGLVAVQLANGQRVQCNKDMQQVWPR